MSCDAVSGSDPFVVFVVVADESGDTAEATVACVSTLSVSDSTFKVAAATFASGFQPEFDESLHHHIAVRSICFALH